VESRKRRLVAMAEEEEERLASEGARAASRLAAAAEAPPRAPTLSQAEQEGRSDWGLFPRQCVLSANGASKDMVYDVDGQSISIRRPLSSFGFWEKIQVSPSEEALALWVTKRRNRMKRKRVLELGSGCGLAGFAVAMCTEAKHVEITDGDPTVCAMLQGNVELNRDAFAAKKVSTQQLVLGEVPEGLKPFDLILAADILDTDANALLITLRRLLKPLGTVLIFASPNNKSLDGFVSSAKSIFERIEVTKHYDEDVTQALHGMSCFPKMVRLERSHALHTAPTRPISREATPTPTALVRSISREAPAECPPATVGVVADVDCREESSNIATSAEVPADKGKWRRDILAARHAQRQSAARCIANATQADAPDLVDASEDPCVDLTVDDGEDEVADAEVRSVARKDSRLPSLTTSRSSSARSILLASEVPPSALGAARHVDDSSTVSGPRSSGSKAAVASFPDLSAFGMCGKGSLSKSQGSVLSAAAASSFWGRGFPNAGGGPGGYNGLAAAPNAAAQCGYTGVAAAPNNGNGTGNAYIFNGLLSSQDRRGSSVPPPGKGKLAGCFLGLAIDGNAMAIQHSASAAPVQRCSGAVARRGKQRSARGYSHEPPRAPVGCA